MQYFKSEFSGSYGLTP